MRQTARPVSIVVVYSADVKFDSVVETLEREFEMDMDAGAHERMDGVQACIMDVRVPGALALRAAQQGPERELPAVRIKMMERFHESWWERHRWGMAIGVGGGLAVALIADLVRLLLARLRELPGSGST